MRRVSRVLSAVPKGGVSTIYLGQSSRKGSINLPAGAGRAARCGLAEAGPRASLFGLSTPEVYPAGVVTQPDKPQGMLVFDIELIDIK